ncbi:Serpin (serine protease inhibitor) [Carpediemonas membranifera]|uniref:Serpin (Serine protease inhibitor) n=1 Tax=Carpediemonas membranifera TaxID=201153 RepID=A0A8J6E009_9EUKA|nr:Serpin (serine protease inhibitor) [Carpediemonas membranifera]|eukprot:KAG9391166.1 Serpin (serine protease inhibitor) [Carpediemonas membranifera]
MCEISGINRLQGQLNQYAFSPTSSSCTSGLSLLYTLLLLFTSVEETSPVYLNLSEVLNFNELSLEAFKSLLKNLGDAELQTSASAFLRAYNNRDPAIEAIQQTYLHSHTRPLTTASAINQWASEHTNGTITEILTGELSRGTEAVLISALYFKAKWQHEFDPTMTAAMPFTLLDGAEKDVPTMNMPRTSRAVWNSAVSTGFVNEYAGSADGLIALFSLPKESGEAGLRASLAELTTRFPERGTHSTSINLSLPKFAIDSSMPLDAFLQQLGLGAMYQTFQFAAETSKPFVSVGTVLQGTHLVVDEQGTEASAVTAMVVRRSYDPTLYTDLAFDRPFAFALVEKATGTRIVTAAIVDPLAVE